MERICVFCGASTGIDPAYADVAAALGRELAARSIEVVTGGGKVGLMGVVADAALAAGGRVIGIIPRFLEQREVAHRGLSELHVVETLHERKALMHELSDAFVALPGGFGTLDELAESVTWAQLGLHAKPIGLVNVAGYFDGLRRVRRGRRQPGVRLGVAPGDPHGARRRTELLDARCVVAAAPGRARAAARVPQRRVRLLRLRRS